MFVERVEVNSVSDAMQEPNSSQKLLNDNSTEKHDDRAQVDINPLDLSCIKTCQKENKKKRATKKGKSYACPISSLGPIEEGALSSVLVLQDNSVRDTPSNDLGKAGDVSSGLAAGKISQEKASGECPNGETLSEKKKKSKRKNKRELTACPITSLGSTKEGPCPSVPDVPTSLVVEISLNQTNKVLAPCDSVELTEKVVTGNSTSALTGGKVSEEMAYSKCPNGESEFVKKKEKSKLGNLEGNNTGHVRIHRRKKRKSSACLISSIEPIEEGVQDSSARYLGLNHSDEAPEHRDEAPEHSYSGKVVEEVVAGLVISQEKASGECLDGEPASGNQRKKSKMENMEESKMGSSVVKDASLVDISETDCERGNKEAVSGKKKKKDKRKKERGVTACPITSLGSMEEGASLAVLVVSDSSMVEISLNQSDKVVAPCDSVKLMEEVVAGSGALSGGKISQEIAFGECPNGESEFGKKKEKSKMGNLEENNAGRVRIHRRKKRRSSACLISSVEPIEEGVQDSSAGYLGMNHSDEAPEPSYSGKVIEEVVAGLIISQEKASGECPDGEPASGNQRKKSKMENMEESNMGSSVVKDASLVDISETDFEQGDKEAVSDKKKKKDKRKKERGVTACPITSLGSTEEGASLSVLVVSDSSMVEIPLNQSEKVVAPCESVKLMEEVVAGNSASVLSGGKISQEIVFGECPNGESEFGKKKEKSKTGKLEESNAGHGRIHMRKKRKSSVWPITNLESNEEGVQESSAGYVALNNSYKAPEPRASDDAPSSVPFVDNIEVDNFGIQPMLNDAIPSSSKLGAMMDGASLESPQSSQGKAQLENSRKKLLVLDVNGLLADIVPSVAGGYKPHKVLSQKAVFKRPFCDDFLQFCFERFHVGVWSSRNRKNVKSVLDFLMGKSKGNLLFCWDQSHCTKTGYSTVENREKPLLLKELKKIWEKHVPNVPWAKGEYNESNTLLLDDSPYKALRNPPHTAIFPHSYCYKDRRDHSLGPGGNLRVYLEGLALADNVRKYVEQNPFGQRPITSSNLSWRFYLKIIGTFTSQQEEDAINDSSTCPQQEEDATNDSLYCELPEEDATNYSSAFQQRS